MHSISELSIDITTTNYCFSEPDPRYSNPFRKIRSWLRKSHVTGITNFNPPFNGMEIRNYTTKKCLQFSRFLWASSPLTLKSSKWVPLWE